MIPVSERHVLFILPPIAVLSAVVIHKILLITKDSQLLKISFVLSSVLYLVLHVAYMVQLHPYQYVYYNRLIGGLNGAYLRFETDYWALSYREADRTG